jgi:hypothetical protein
MIFQSYFIFIKFLRLLSESLNHKHIIFISLRLFYQFNHLKIHSIYSSKAHYHILTLKASLPLEGLPQLISNPSLILILRASFELGLI